MTRRVRRWQQSDEQVRAALAAVMRCLEITATTPFGVVSGRPWGISLDGILASVLWADAKQLVDPAGARVVEPYSPAVSPPDLALPLQRCVAPDGTWHWMCTFGLVDHPDDDLDVRLRTRRTDHTGMARLAETVSANIFDTRGRYRARTVPALAAVTSTVRWRAVGDATEINDLLARVGEIGKHRNTGEGVVTDWTITPAVPEQSQWAYGHEHQPGVLGRIAPAHCVHTAPTPVREHGGRSRAAIRPPYIHASRVTEAYLPAY